VRHLVDDDEFYAQNNKKQQEEVLVHSGQHNEEAIQRNGFENHAVG
jgi:hypothetical protein